MRLTLASLTATIALFLASCASAGFEPGMDNGPDVGGTYYTLCNLHPDPAKQTLASINYLQIGIIPLGSEVKIDSRNAKRMQFTVADTGVQYTWVYTKHTRQAGMSLADNLTLFFGRDPAAYDSAQFSDADNEGIRLGNVTVGMSRAGVLLAIGTPPAHGTPNLKLPTWTYWKNVWTRRTVTFGPDGLVSEVKG